MNYRIANVLIFLVIFISVSLLSFRSDYLFNSDHGFHLSYFIQPIISMNEGYRLLVDQPSQYGFMNILIPYLIDFNGPINSFHIFQGLLNIFVIIIVVILSIFILKIKQFNFFIFLFSILLFLSSTDLYGPQVYPSTGVVRFFPVYLVILAQCYIRNINSSFLCEVLCLSLCVFISLLWGAEALFYTLFSIAFYYLQDLLFNPSWEKFKERLYKGLIILGLSISCTFIILKIYQYGFEIESLNIGLHFSFITTYGSKAISGQTPNIFTPILIITIPLLITLIINKNNSKNYQTITCYGSIIIAVLSYSFMRSIANNVNNLWPILFLCFAVMYFEIKKRNLDEDVYSLKIILLPCLIISSLCMGNILINYNTIPKILKSNKIIINNNNFKREFALEEKDIKIQKAIEEIDWKVSSLSIMTWSGKTGNGLNSEIIPFLPGPAVSLTYHDDAYIMDILVNSKNFSSREGFLLHDKYWDTYKKLTNIVLKMKDCKLLVFSNRYDFYQCYSVIKRINE